MVSINILKLEKYFIWNEKSKQNLLTESRRKTFGTNFQYSPMDIQYTFYLI